MKLTDGVMAVVKRDCPTCEYVEPVLAQLAAALGSRLQVYSQDDPSFPSSVPEVIDDRQLDVSWALDLTTVPTLVLIEDGVEVGRVVGWLREQWEELTSVGNLGPGLAGYRPGCGSLTLDPEVAETLAIRHRGPELRARRVALADLEDEAEAAFDRGWTDGLPVVAPTIGRVLAMLDGTSRRPEEIVAVVPPTLVEATVEKVAINAVMAGCRPEYLPVVLAAVEAACSDEFNAHGVLATTWFAAPMIVVNGPIARAIGMNSGVNALGQGNRANATIGRALQLVIRNVGGGVPGGIDRATLGTPGKYTFCFAEDEAGSPWEPLSVSRGLPLGTSAVTVFAAGGVHGVADQLSRTPDSLARSLAVALRSVAHPKLVIGFDAFLVVSPDHARVFKEAGWDRSRLTEELDTLLTIPGAEIVRGAGGIAEGVPDHVADKMLPKFRPGGLLIAHAGGTAGLFSAVIDGWVGGPGGSVPVTREVLR
ncbi:MAG: thioredoxin family protein [Actinomycetota bacterium]|nr:thioredoxin family protein [Actinomycetota bacterium]